MTDPLSTTEAAVAADEKTLEGDVSALEAAIPAGALPATLLADVTALATALEPLLAALATLQGAVTTDGNTVQTLLNQIQADLGENQTTV